MTQITAGYIIYSQQSEPGVFGAPKAEVRLDFGVETGDQHNDIFDQASREAKRRVRVLIGLEKPAPAIDAVNKMPVAAVGVEAGAGPKPAENTATIAATSAENKPRGRPKAPKIETAKDPAVVTIPVSAEQMAADVVEVDPALAEIMGTQTAAPKAREITDKELSHDAAEAVKRLQPKHGAEAPKKVTALIYEYTGGPPKGLMSVPADKRAEFLEKLAAL